MGFATETDTARTPASAGHERRTEQRRRVLKGGLLTFNRGFGALECRVRNQSDGGALLNFGDTAAVPPSFTLRIGGDGPRFATVRWRSLSDIGVSLE